MTAPAGSPPDPLPVLSGPGVALRRLTEHDLDALLEIFGDPRVARFMGIPLLKGAADARRLLRDVEAQALRRTLLQWGVVRAGDVDDGETGRVLGTCSLADLDWANRRAEIGFALAAAHWGRGLMKQALPLLLDHAFGPLGLHRLEADVDPRNAPSLHLLETLGFRREGYLRERHRQEADGSDHQGEWQDSVFLGLLAGEWEGGA